MSRGRFITFEGGEGGGKSTQVRLLAERLRNLVPEVIVTREPGGSAGAEAIRELVVKGSTDRWSPVTETLLFYAARRDHIERVIGPGLERGAWIVCDRFADSTRAYQDSAGGAPAALIDALEQQVLDGVKPDLTLILDLPVAAGLARAAGRDHLETRFESKGEAFHERLRAAFRDIAAAEPERCAVIDADASREAVSRAIWNVVEQRLGTPSA